MILRSLRQWVDAHPARAGTIAGWYQQFCGAIAALIVVPLVIRNLGASDAGLWFAFQSLLGIINLTDFGLSFVVARQIAYSLHAPPLQKEPVRDFISTRPGWMGVSDIYHLSRQLFFRASFGAAIVLVLLYHVVLPIGNLLATASNNAIFAWYLLGAATVLSLQAKPHFALIEGLGRLFVTRFVSGTFQLITGIAVVCIAFSRAGLVPMASAVCIIALFQYGAARYVALRVLGNREIPPEPAPPGLLKKLLRVAWPMGILNLSAFLFSSIQVPLLGSLFGPKMVPAFFLAQRIGQALNQAVSQLVGPQLPLYTQNLAKGDCHAAGNRMVRTIASVTGLALAANAFFVFAIPYLVDLWVGPGRFVDPPTLQIMALDYFILSASVVWAHFVLASGSNPFVWTTCLGGLLNVCFCFLFARWGTMGIAMASLVSGCLTNYWFTTWTGIGLLSTIRKSKSGASGPIAEVSLL
jgi:O-antigen/teichoic acid export membrane protein